MFCVSQEDVDIDMDMDMVEQGMFEQESLARNNRAKGHCSEDTVVMDNTNDMITAMSGSVAAHRLQTTTTSASKCSAKENCCLEKCVLSTVP